jgi:pyrroloquinoline quinone (PQQ) biosynthesis protein C
MNANVKETNARTTAYAIVEASVPPPLWAGNAALVEQLIVMIRSHALMQHPIMGRMSEGGFDAEGLRYFHLEYRHAFAQPFTTALSQAMVLAAGLEERLGAIGPISARFLLTLNFLDELGFRARDRGYGGTPLESHYMRLQGIFDQLGVEPEQRRAYAPSAAAVRCRGMMEESYGDYVRLTAALALIETIAPPFMGAVLDNLQAQKAEGEDADYYEEHAEGDDVHARDSWVALMQAMTPDRHEEVRSAMAEWLDRMVGLADSMLQRM